ncbi:MAG: hypothetical protein JW789_02940 [Candidatus Aenigmarchaeota archaeon]|nr:hypothetical protein [Candidatus Aenigmarchaeota archaeon]
MDKELDAAKRAALEAGKILMKHYGRVSAEKKSDGTDVTIADRESEAAIKTLLTREFPDYSFMGEETGMDDRGFDYKWVQQHSSWLMSQPEGLMHSFIITCSHGMLRQDF